MSDSNHVLYLVWKQNIDRGTRSLLWWLFTPQGRLVRKGELQEADVFSNLKQFMLEHGVAAYEIQGVFPPNERKFDLNSRWVYFENGERVRYSPFNTTDRARFEFTMEYF